MGGNRPPLRPPPDEAVPTPQRNRHSCPTEHRVRDVVARRNLLMPALTSCLAQLLGGGPSNFVILPLSEQTRGWMRDFVSYNFGMPPEFCDSPDMLPLLI